MGIDFNSELHARPSIYFEGPSLVEHVALLPLPRALASQRHSPSVVVEADTSDVRTQIEHHTEFTTVTRVSPISSDAQRWPQSLATNAELADLAGLQDGRLICRTAIFVTGPARDELGPLLRELYFGDTAASYVGGGAAQVCSDFRVRSDETSRIVVFNKDLNPYRLGRMVRRLYEIETYRAMALLGLSDAKRVSASLAEFDARLVALTSRNLKTGALEHKSLLEDISLLSAQVISSTAETRNRFGATAAYAQIVDERIAELREHHVPGFQRYGIFITRRFKPAMRTCALRPCVLNSFPTRRCTF